MKLVILFIMAGLAWAHCDDGSEYCCYIGESSIQVNTPSPAQACALGRLIGSWNVAVDRQIRLVIMYLKLICGLLVLIVGLTTVHLKFHPWKLGIVLWALVVLTNRYPVWNPDTVVY
jgi:hypothetical protein